MKHDIKATTISARDARRRDFRVTPEMDGRGIVVALRPMRLKAQRSSSPFIVRNAA